MDTEVDPAGDVPAGLLEFAQSAPTPEPARETVPPPPQEAETVPSPPPHLSPPPLAAPPHPAVPDRWQPAPSPPSQRDEELSPLSPGERRWEDFDVEHDGEEFASALRSAASKRGIDVEEVDPYAPPERLVPRWVPAAGAFAAAGVCVFSFFALLIEHTGLAAAAVMFLVLFGGMSVCAHAAGLFQGDGGGGGWG